MTEQDRSGSKKEGATFSMDVSEVCTRNNVFIIHGIHPNFSPGGNTILYPSAGWQDKLDIVLAMQPNLSASSIRAGDDHTYLWSRMGVVLSEGEVVAGWPQDAGTVAISLKKRRYNSSVKSTVDQAVGRVGSLGISSGYKYNELEVSGAQICGFYVCLDKTEGRAFRNLADLGEIVSEVGKRKIPLFVMLDGQIYQPAFTDNEDNQVFTKQLVLIQENAEKKGSYEEAEELLEQGWKLLEPAQLTQMTLRISEEDKQQKISDILEKRIFNLNLLTEKLPWIHHIASFSQGRESYIALMSRKLLEGADKTVYKGCPGLTSPGKDLPAKGDRVALIDGFSITDTDNRYIFWEGKIYKEMYSPDVKEYDLYPLDTDRIKRGTIRLGNHNISLHKNIYNHREFVSEMEKEISRRTQIIADLESLGDPHKARVEGFDLGRIIYNLYGFAKQAEKLGDEQATLQAYEVIDSVTTRQGLDELLKRRTDDKGRVILNLEDLH